MDFGDDQRGDVDETYVDAPELLDRVKCDDFLQRIGPVVLTLKDPKC